MTKLIAIHSIQTTDKDGKRVDVAPGKQFEAGGAKEAGELIAAGAARKPVSDDKHNLAAASSADNLPEPPAGYAPGTPTDADVNADPNAADAETETAKGEAAAAKVESSNKTSGNRR